MAETPAQPPVLVPRPLPAAPTSLCLWDRFPVIVDTNVLLADCVHIIRSGKTSFLLASGALPIAHLFATERVREEVEEHLPTHAQRGGLDPEDAMTMWRERYLPVIRFVNLDGDTGDERVAKLAARHVNDKPTGLLAELLAPCLVFSRDRDLLDTGIARREWVTLSSAGHDVAQMRAIYTGGMFGTLLVGVTGWEAGSAVVAAAKAAPLPTLLVGGAAAWFFWRFWWNTELGAQQRADARNLIKAPRKASVRRGGGPTRPRGCSRPQRLSLTGSRRLWHRWRASLQLR
jgi:PIN domain